MQPQLRNSSGKVVPTWHNPTQKGNPINACFSPDLTSVIAIAIVQGKMEEQS
jgi:hypothetical protein